MERIVSKGDDFVVDTLFYFKPVHRFEFRRDMFSFGSSSYCASKGDLQNWRRDICFCGKFR